MERRNAWFEYTEAEEKELEKVNASYREFLNNGKTERECVKEIIRQAEAAGYQSLQKKLKDKEIISILPAWTSNRILFMRIRILHIWTRIITAV